MKHSNQILPWLSLLFFFSSFSLFAQEELVLENLTVNNATGREIGLNANTFIHNLFFRERNLVLANQYMLYTRRYFKNNKYRRQGFNLLISGRAEQTEGEPNREIFEFGIDYRLGGGKYKEVLDKVTLFWGTDWLLEPSFKIVKIAESEPTRGNGNKTTSNSIAMGIGPFIGVQYNFTERLGIFTEANFYWYISHETDKITFDDSSRDAVLDRQFRYFFSNTPLAGIVLFYKL